MPRPVEGTPTDGRADVEAPRDEPWTVIQGFPDRVLIYKDPVKETIGIVIAVEVQKWPKLEKRWRIPFYQAVLAATHRLETWCVVVSFSRVFSRALRKWATGPPPRVDALVLDVDSVPTLSLEQARARPTAAVLAAALHGSVGTLEPVRVALQVLRELPRETRKRYIPIILSVLPKPTRDLLIGEIPMLLENDLARIERESGTYFYGHQAGLEQGRRITLIELIFTILDLRGITVDPESASRIRETEPLSLLERWARLAREIEAVPELFDAARA
ncbi:MAG: hypothetical protein KC457_01145 [Myxococcales bacterium]|nr:hypothetical protein [Myxococcales bacterium]